jgi:hypothetical protein
VVRPWKSGTKAIRQRQTHGRIEKAAWWLTC